MLETFFSPQSVAVIGVSRDSHKLGYGVIRNLVEYKFKGNIYPVNKHAAEILDLRCYASISDLPEGVELVVIVVPAQAVPLVLKQCGERNIKNAIVVSSSKTGRSSWRNSRIASKARDCLNHGKSIC